MDGRQGGVVSMGGVGGVEAVVTKALVLGDSNASCAVSAVTTVVCAISAVIGWGQALSR